MADRREALKIIGAIGTTCAFPFSAGELYGQHVHGEPGKQASPSAPQFFKTGEYAAISALANLIIPDTDTPGAVAAGVPAYIDYVVRNNRVHQETFRLGLEWLEKESRERHGEDFVKLTEEQQIAILQPVSDAVDRGSLSSQAEKFFRAAKAMTADGYYTSRIGLMQELGFQGGAVLAEYPSCEVPEH